MPLDDHSQSTHKERVDLVTVTSTGEDVDDEEVVVMDDGRPVIYPCFF